MYRLQNLLILTEKQLIFASKYMKVQKRTTSMLKRTVTDRIRMRNYSCLNIVNLMSMKSIGKLFVICYKMCL